MLRRLSKRFNGVPVFVTPDAALRFWRRDIESADQDLFNWVEQYVKPGDVVWDIGGNVGLFSFAAAARAGAAGSVLTVEPDVTLVRLLQRSAHAQPSTSAPTTVLPAGASNKLAIATFHVVMRGRASNYLDGTVFRTQTGGVRERVSTLTVTLDWLLTQSAAPSFIKIDVEGAEVLVLGGATDLLRRVRPRLIVEASAETYAEVTAILREANYTLRDLDGVINILAEPN